LLPKIFISFQPEEAYDYRHFLSRDPILDGLSMKILYVAANPYEKGRPPDFTPEITEIQRRVLEATAVEFVVMPSLKFEDLASTLHRHRPDVLHIAAHGVNENLFLANQNNEPIKIDAEMLLTFMSDRSPPRLVYLNACNSFEIAKKLTGSVPTAIGSTAPITVKAARVTAVSFYERILDGASVERAFQVCKQVMRGISAKQASMEKYHKVGIDPSAEFLHVEPRFIAEFLQRKPKRDRKEKSYEIRFGIMGCPPTTQQVVFFTDDPESITEDTDSEEAPTLQEDLCTVVREPPRRGWIRADDDDAWDIDGDFRLYAVGVYGPGLTFTVSTMLCDALEECNRVSHGTAIPRRILEAIADLRKTDGSLEREEQHERYSDHFVRDRSKQKTKNRGAKKRS
jgi:hypothetical protein